MTASQPLAPVPPAAAPARSLAPDIARGLMLALIALANVSWHLWGREPGLTTPHLVEGSGLDKLLQALMTIAVDGRSYPLFAFLFGYGMVQFSRSRLARGLEEPVVRRMLRRRHWALVLFGLVHAALLFMGDVLGAYGLAGLLLVWLFFRRTDRTLWIWSGVLAGLLLLSAVFALIGGIATLVFAPDAMAGPIVVPHSQDVTAGATSYLSSIPARLGTWAFITPVQLLTSSIPPSILLGWLAARHRLLDDPRAHLPLLRRLAAWGIAIGWLGGLAPALAKLGVLPVPPEMEWMFTGLTGITGVGAGVGYACVFALIAARWQDSPPALLRAITAVGKRSLTFYLWQSLVFAVVMSAWAFGVGGWAGTSLALLIALLTWAVSVPMAWALERRGMPGPAEAVLRRLTYGRHDPALRAS